MAIYVMTIKQKIRCISFDRYPSDFSTVIVIVINYFLFSIISSARFSALLI